MKDFQVTGEAFRPKKEHPVLQNMKFLHFFIFVKVIFDLLNPDQCGSGSTTLVDQFQIEPGIFWKCIDKKVFGSKIASLL